MNTSLWKEHCILSPSLICLDLTNLEKQANQLTAGGIRMLHVDILDGHFSPSMPLGLDTVRQLREKTDLAFDCHVMTTANDYFVSELLDIGVQQIVFHGETEPHVDGMLKRIRAAGVRAGVALKPATSLSSLDYVLELCDTVLLMLINPGYAFMKGEKQIPYAKRKIEELRDRIEKQGLPTLIELDGRISPDNIRNWSEIADIFVTGSTCLRRDDLLKSLAELNALRNSILFS